MDVFFSLFVKIIPLYFIIALGFVAGRFLSTQRETVARLLIYIVAPVVIFNSVLTTKLSLNVLSLSLLFFVLCSLMCLFTYFFAKKIWQDATKNIVAFTAGTANTGYFGLPVAMALFGADIAGLVVIFILGVVINLMGVTLGESWFDFAVLFRGAYSVLGMMLIGMGLSSIKKFEIDFKFVSVVLVMKFIVWPLVALAVVIVDSKYFHFFDLRIYKVMMLMSIVPLAANSVAFATELKVHPEKTAVAVLISTVVALFYIPLAVSWFWVP